MFQLEKVFRGSAKDQAAGFIHFCARREDCDRVHKKYFAKEKAFLLTADLPNVVLERASDGNLYPHLYGVLPWEAVVECREFEEAK